MRTGLLVLRTFAITVAKFSRRDDDDDVERGEICDFSTKNNMTRDS